MNAVLLLIVRYFLLLFFLNFSFISNFYASQSNLIKKIIFGKYDEYTFLLYENTRSIVKHNRLIVGTVIELHKNVQCEYKFVLTMPSSVFKMKIWKFSEWGFIKQNQQLSYSLTNRSMTHNLKDNVYIVKGFYDAGDSDGFLRALYKVETLVIGNYNLDIFINDVFIEAIKFDIYQPL